MGDIFSRREQKELITYTLHHRKALNIMYCIFSVIAFLSWFTGCGIVSHAEIIY